MNSVTFERSQDGTQANSISKKCASFQACQSSIINIGICSGDLTDPTAFPSGTSCSFCCNESSPTGIPCNANLRPNKAINFLTMATPAPVVSSRRCLQCGDPTSGKPCGPGDLLLGTSQPCPPGLNFCMNDIYEKAGDGKTIYKRCVAENECKNKWFKESSDSPECTDYNPRGAVTSDLTCHFCCTSDGCNIPTKPKESSLWTPFYTGG
ncbi:succinate dehydrogenase [ubiquinone] flavoprotein subunit, mitochondrial [Elysia marginata]|uniref:Succinate dehydrogenase [ubiquinone] flavoprotein subunit, mitochondrial n=1 Tax=Elysia marginata TaxID=1093978 RepID=A0AAV4JWZ6_9GAST|nr:succinate dehydrogenase [ubiquinone] flavoprotein subunit, mitochondrial [Elysia marginata]